MRAIAIILMMAFFVACNQNSNNDSIDENKLGFIDASVKSEETNLKEKAKFSDTQPGKSEAINRAFENAPPMIPHTTEGFFPIKIDNNICLSCHLPDKVEKTGAVAIPKMHFTNLRPKMKLIDGKYEFSASDTLHREKIETLNSAYFNCNQCHAPQANVTVNIKNLFTPEFREEFGIKESTLDKQFEDGL